MTRVHSTTVRCDGCGIVLFGEFLHGLRCSRCEMGTLMNTALIAADETPRPFDEGEGS